MTQGQQLVNEAVTAVGLGGDAEITDEDDQRANVRRIILDMIEEYARHVGHADLIRESVDGLVGEDPPDEFTPTR